MVGMVGGAILRSHGDARAAMMATVWGAVATAVLDPILIFGLKLELTGAALASVAARILIAWVALRPIRRRYGGFGRPYWLTDYSPDFPVRHRAAVITFKGVDFTLTVPPKLGEEVYHAILNAIAAATKGTKTK